MLLFYMNIIGFVGSPHKNGNTAWVVNQIINGAKQQGAKTQVFYASDLNINFCKGCRACMNKKGCVIKDDMQKIYNELKTADALILGSPNYMGQMSGQAKLFVDRLSAEISPRFSPKFKPENAGKKLILAFTQGNPDKDKFKVYYDYTKDMFKLLEFDVKDLVVVAGTRDTNANEMKVLRTELENIGQKLKIAD